MSLRSQIESLLFISPRPLAIKKIQELTQSQTEQVEEALSELQQEYQQKTRGIVIQRIGSKVQMATKAANTKLVKDFLKDEATGELTRPSLEALTIIAYRGPVTKLELEQIRGVNCSLILRNLMIRGLIESLENKKTKQTVYQITFDFLKFLGVSSLEELPRYERLHSSEILEKMLEVTSKKL